MQPIIIIKSCKNSPCTNPTNTTDNNPITSKQTGQQPQTKSTNSNSNCAPSKSHSTSSKSGRSTPSPTCTSCWPDCPTTSLMSSTGAAASPTR